MSSPFQRRLRTTGRRETGSFTAIPHAITDTRKYASLSAWGVKLMLDIATQYTGKNNGDLTASWTVMSAKGWRSKGTLQRAVDELQAVGFIMRTRQGGRHVCTLYALTWQSIDECLDRRTGLSKHDLRPTQVAPGGWQDDRGKAA